jgi:hypothetical protein
VNPGEFCATTPCVPASTCSRRRAGEAASLLTRIPQTTSDSDVGSGVALWIFGTGEWCSRIPGLMRYCSGSAWPTPSHADQMALKTPLAAPEGGQSATVAGEVSQTSSASVLSALGFDDQGWTRTPHQRAHPAFHVVSALNMEVQGD